jgi:hypothetical protein
MPIRFGRPALPAKDRPRRINRCLLEVECVSDNSGLSSDSVQRVVQPIVTEDGERKRCG